MRNFLTNRNSDFGFDLFNVFDDFFVPTFTGGNRYMNTDIKESDNGYELSIDMPGFDKSDLTLTLKDGYLTVSANKAQKDEDGAYLKRERKMQCSRSYFVGKDVTEEDVKAKYLNGTLVLGIPKKQAKISEPKSIAIE